MEDYIAAIWRLTRTRGAASTSAVANRLGVAAATTSYMFKKMAESGLVEYREYAGVTLTAAGEQAARSYIRRHRVTERFLVDVLSIAWDQVDEITDQMEHSLPDEVIDRMEDFMGRPGTCPHGFLIPGKDGGIPERPVRPLSDLGAGESGVIAQVGESDPALLRYLSEHRLVPGEPVAVLEHDRIGETYALGVGRDRLTVGTAIARQIWIEA